MIHYIYRIDFLCGEPSGRYYLGQHSTEDINDNYTGSGIFPQRYFEKYSKIENVTYRKTILQYASSYEELNKLEDTYIGTKYYEDPLCMNLCSGGNVRIMHPDIINNMKEKMHTEEWHNAQSDRMKGNTNGRGCKDKPFTETHLRNLRGKKAGKHYPKMSEVAKERNKRKEWLDKQHEAQKDRTWVTNGSETKRIKIELVPEYLALGYSKGRSLK